MKKTLRLTFPEWQGGVNPNYYMGSRLLTWLAPEGKNCESAEVPVETDFGAEVPVTGGRLIIFTENIRKTQGFCGLMPIRIFPSRATVPTNTPWFSAIFWAEACRRWQPW